MPLTARHKALAAEALIRHPDLTPAARRVGLELLNHADRRTGISWPSEARMAEALGVDPRTIRRGKAALRAAGLLTWKSRGRHKTPVYTLVWDRLVQLAAVIKQRVKAACSAAQTAITTAKSSTSPPTSKPAGEGPRRLLGRTFLPGYLTHQGFKGAYEGRNAAPRQILTDAQLVARASARFWSALQALGPHVMAEFISHPQATALQEQAIHAERFKPDQGRTGITTLLALLKAEPA